MKHDDFYRSLIDKVPFGYAYCRIITRNSKTPVDFECIEVNRSVERLTGLRAEDVVGRRASEIFPEITGNNYKWLGLFGEVALTGETREFEKYFDPLGKWFRVQANSCEKNYFSVTFTDITTEKEQYEGLERFFTVNLDLLCIADTDGRFVKVNRAWESTLGYSIRELENRKFVDLVHPDDLEATLKALKKLGRNEKVLNFVNRYRCRDGSYRYIEWRSNPYGKLIYSSARDITERKKTEQALMHYTEMQYILMNLSLKFINMPSGQVGNSINDALRELGEFVNADRAYIFEYDFEKNLASNTYEWCNDGIAPQIGNMQNFSLEYLTGWPEKHKRGEMQYVADVNELPGDDEMRKLLESHEIKSMIAFPMMSGDECIGFVGFDSVKEHNRFANNEIQLLELFAQIMVNIRNRSRIEKELQNYADKMELKSLQLDMALLQSEANSKAKSEFLASMSHEIRTPLNGVIGFTELLASTSLDPDQKRYVDYASNSARTLLEIINDILDLSKIEAGRLELEEIRTDIIDLLRSTAGIIKCGASKKGIRLLLNLDGEVPRYIIADPYRLKQVLINLLSNAVKFTNKGEIEMKLDFSPGKAKSDPGEFYFSVRDTGIGITVEQHKNLFRAFTQADSSTTRKFGGTGLGLVITKSLLEKMGSKLKMESVPGEGSTFCFTLRRDYEKAEWDIDGSGTVAADLKSGITFPGKDPALKGDIKRAPESMARAQKILIAEDVGLNMKLLKLLVKKTLPEALVIEARDGSEAVNEYMKHKPDMVFMDIQMPVKNGYTATSEIREYQRSMGIYAPIVAVTARAMKGERENCLDAGMDDYLTKPIDLPTIRFSIERYLGAARSGKPDQAAAVTLKSPLPLREMIIKHFSFGEDVIVRLIDKALPSFRSEIDNLETAIEKTDIEGIEMSAHNIRGMALNLFCDKVAMLGRGIEENSGADREKLTALLEELKNEYLLAEVEMRSLVVSG